MIDWFYSTHEQKEGKKIIKGAWYGSVLMAQHHSLLLARCKLNVPKNYTFEMNIGMENIAQVLEELKKECTYAHKILSS